MLHTFSTHAGRYWEMVERLGVKQFYGAPTAIRLLLKAGDDHVHKYDRSSLTTLGCGQCRVLGLLKQSHLSPFLFPSFSLWLSVGEPLNDEAWLWYHNVVGDGRCTVVDTWWQTGKYSQIFHSGMTSMVQTHPLLEHSSYGYWLYS